MMDPPKKGEGKLHTFILQDGDEVEVVAEDGDEVVVRGRDDRREVSSTRGFTLSLKEIVTHRATDNTAPVLLHKYLPVHSIRYSRTPH